MDKKALIVIPTYNELENITEMVNAIGAVKASHDLEVLVVDSNSPDGTGERLEEMAKAVPFLRVLHQPRKMGLGCAYLDGFRHAREQWPGRYNAVLTMDADFSHHPRYLPAMLEKLEQSDVVLGSRYIPGGRLENWPTRRKWLSRFANAYAAMLTGARAHDLTSGFHCFKTPVLEKILTHKISAEGYAFLIELKVYAIQEGFSIAEVPIVFADRTKGASKISKNVIAESAMVVAGIFLKRIWAAVFGRCKTSTVRG